MSLTERTPQALKEFKNYIQYLTVTAILPIAFFALFSQPTQAQEIPVTAATTDSHEVWGGRTVTEAAEFAGNLRLIVYELDENGQRTGKVERQDVCSASFSEVWYSHNLAHCLNLEQFSDSPSFNHPEFNFPFKKFEFGVEIRGGSYNLNELDAVLEAGDFSIPWDAINLTTKQTVPTDFLTIVPTQQSAIELSQRDDVTTLPLLTTTPNGALGRTFGYGNQDAKLTRTDDLPVYGDGFDFIQRGYETVGSIGSLTVITNVQSGAAGDSGGPTIVWQDVNGTRKAYLAGPVIGGIAEGTQPYFYTDITDPTISDSITKITYHYNRAGFPAEPLVLRVPRFTTETVVKPIKLNSSVGQGGLSITINGEVQEIMAGYTVHGRRARVDVTYTNPDQCIVDVQLAPQDGIETAVLNELREPGKLNAIVQTVFQDVALFQISNFILKLDHESGSCAPSPEAINTITSSVTVITEPTYDLRNSEGIGGKPVSPDDTQIMTTTVEIVMENRKWIPVDAAQLEQEGAVISLYTSATGTLVGKRSGKNIIFTGTGTMQNAIVTFDGITATTLKNGQAIVSYPTLADYLLYLPTVASDAAATR